LGLSSQQTNVLNSFGLVGLFFTIPAGFVNDRFGSFRTMFLSTFLVVGGYLITSFLNKEAYPAMVICMAIVGFGGGAVFTCSLSIAIKTVSKNPGLGVAVVGGAMSLSMALVGVILLIYKSATGCTDASCWRGYVRVLAFVAAIMMWPSSFLVRLYETRLMHRVQNLSGLVNGGGGAGGGGNDDSMRSDVEIPSALLVGSGSSQNFESDSDADDGYTSEELLFNDAGNQKKKRGAEVKSYDAQGNEKPVSFLGSFLIVKNAFFLFLALSYTVGIGSGLLVVTQTQQLVLAFAGQENVSWVTPVSISFSIANAVVGGGLSGIVSDYIVKRHPRFTRAHLYAFIFLAYTAVFFALALISSLPPGIAHNNTPLAGFVMLLIVLVGIEFGCNFTLGPAIIGELYGGVNFGVYFGYFQILTVVSTFAVPALATIDLQSTGNFAIMFYVFQFLLAICAALLLLKKPTAIGQFW
jgi:MFS family permease